MSVVLRPEAALLAPFSASPSPHDYHHYQGSTRILLTHQRQFLPRCDRVLVLRAGSIQALGSWEEVAGLNLPELTAGALGSWEEVAGLHTGVRHGFCAVTLSSG